jgi:hypothetical protein
MIGLPQNVNKVKPDTLVITQPAPTRRLEVRPKRRHEIHTDPFNTHLLLHRHDSLVRSCCMLSDPVEACTTLLQTLTLNPKPSAGKQQRQRLGCNSRNVDVSSSEPVNNLAG